MSITAVAGTALDAAISAHDASSVIAQLTPIGIDDQTSLWHRLNDIGQRFFSEGYFGEAAKLLEHARQVAPDETSTLVSVQYLTGCYFELREHAKEQASIRIELRILKQNYQTNLASIIDLTKSLGLSNFREGKVKDAFCCFNEALTMTRQIAKQTDTETELLVLMQNCREIYRK